MFATGQGVRTYSSADLKVWTPGPPVFREMPAWHREVVSDHRGHLWAPEVIKNGGRYLLYYSVSAWGRNASAIGLASNPTLDPTAAKYAWRDEGIVVRSFATNDFNAIDPAVVVDEQNRFWLTFGSFWSGIKLVELDGATGRRASPEGPIYSLAQAETIEAPCLHRHGEYYYLFVNWGLCCRGTNSTYEIRVGRSPTIHGPYLDQDGRDLLTGGGVLLLGSTGSMIGPGHAGILSSGNDEILSFHYYDARQGGRPTLGLKALTWNTDGWPTVASQSPPVQSGTAKPPNTR